MSPIEGPPNGNSGRLRGRRERKPRAAVVIAVVALVSLAAVACSSRTAERPPSEDQRPGTAPSHEASWIEGPFGQVGGWIAYSGDDGIWAVDPARPERWIRLSRADGDPIAWSSDGTKLLIRRESPNQIPAGVREMDLVALEADGTETRLTNAQAFVTGGSFSPDGSEVVYATTYSPKGSAIYAVSSDGGAPRLILRATRRVSIEGGSFLTDVYHPALSRDGTRIAYFDGFGDHSHNLWVVNADGTERRILLDDEFSGAGHMNALTWSPDGEWLAFTTDDSLYLVRPDGTGLRRVVSGGFGTAPAVQWSPDGSRIAYLRMGPTCGVSADGEETCEAGALSIVNVDGGDEQLIEDIRTPGNAWIAWNPRV